MIKLNYGSFKNFIEAYIFLESTYLLSSRKFNQYHFPVCMVNIRLQPAVVKLEPKDRKQL